MMLFLILATSLNADATAAPRSDVCPPIGYDRTALRAARASGWQLRDDAEKNELALALTSCLASEDKELRDELAFSGIQNLMRSGDLTAESIVEIADQMQDRLTLPDPSGFMRPFAALTLAEVARADRKSAVLTTERRRSLVGAAVRYLSNVSDYRGFDDARGWRHGVAHGADLIMQLSLNPAQSRNDLIKLRDAIAVQISPSSHFYVYGEPQRLAAPILFMAQRKEFSQADWDDWLAKIASPEPLSSWDNAFSHNRDMARLHNVRAFVQALYLNARLNSNAEDDVLLEPLAKLIARLP